MRSAARFVVSLGISSACAAWPLACGAQSLAQSPAQSVSEATADSLLRSAVSAPPAAAASAPQPRAVWQARRSADLSSLRVIELPDEGPRLGPPARRHHALMWHSDALSQALGNAGLANADCHHRVRLPSRLRAAPDGGPALQVQLQVAIGCSF